MRSGPKLWPLLAAGDKRDLLLRFHCLNCWREPGHALVEALLSSTEKSDGQSEVITVSTLLLYANSIGPEYKNSHTESFLEDPCYSTYLIKCVPGFYTLIKYLECKYQWTFEDIQPTPFTVTTV